MLTTLIGNLITALLKVLPETAIKEGLDAFLDKIENAVEKSGNKIDDTIVLPICEIIRKQLNVEDND